MRFASATAMLGLPNAVRKARRGSADAGMLAPAVSHRLRRAFPYFPASLLLIAALDRRHC